MSETKDQMTPKSHQKPSRQGSSLMSALLLGLPLAAGLLFVLRFGPWQGTLLDRYSSHPVEQVEIVIFCCALGALWGKFWGVRRQRRALKRDLLPEWDGTALPPSEAPTLLAHLSKLPRRLQKSWIGKRTRDILSFVCRRRSASDLDSHIRAVSDTDAYALENSYSLIRFLIWSMPILGFLGTVLGIAGAIAGVTPEALEQSIGTVTQGLALAFDTTGLALMLTITTMFLNFIVEKQEQSTLDQVDDYIDMHLTHRFIRAEGNQEPVLDAVEAGTKAILDATQLLVKRQAELWASTLAESDQRMMENEKLQHERLTRSLETAMDRALTVHQQRLLAMQQEMEQQTIGSLEPLSNLTESMRQHQETLQPLTEATQALAGVLAQMQKQEGQLARLQLLLQQNLASLSSTGSFEQAVHSLTAAIHLLTARGTTAPTLRVADEERAA